MLAISRALLTNPQLLIMDEPTEGLAPVIVAQVEEMLVRLGEDGEMSVLVIEQNIGVATAISQECRDHGQRPDQPHHRLRAPVGRPRTAAAPAGRWRRGVHAEPETDIESADANAEAEGASRAATRPEGGADPDLHLQSHAADTLVAARVRLRVSRPPRARFRPA